MVSDFHSPHPNRRYLVEIGQIILLDLLDRRLSAGTPPSKRALLVRLEPVWEEVMDRLHYPWSVEEMARIAGFSRSQFARRCMECYGVSPARKLTRYRVDAARALLMDSDCPVYEIAERVGYGDPFAFSTAFRRWVGVGPRAYRNGKTGKEVKSEG